MFLSTFLRLSVCLSVRLSAHVCLPSLNGLHGYLSNFPSLIMAVFFLSPLSSIYLLYLPLYQTICLPCLSHWLSVCLHLLSGYLSTFPLSDYLSASPLSVAICLPSSSFRLSVYLPPLRLSVYLLLFSAICLYTFPPLRLSVYLLLLSAICLYTSPPPLRLSVGLPSLNS